MRYDEPEGRLYEIEIPRRKIEYTYRSAGSTGAGLVETVSSPDTVTLHYTYDGPLVLAERTSGALADTVSVTYDALLRPATMAVNEDAIALRYNLDQQLIGAGIDSLHHGNGNRVSATRWLPAGQDTATATYDGQDRMTRYGKGKYHWNASGELARRIVPNGAGNDTTTYAYDQLVNLTNVRLPMANPIVTYNVDGRNRRVARYVNGTFQRGWIWQDGLRVAGELDSTGALAIRYVYGSRGTVPDYLARYGTTYRIIADQLGSVRMVVDVSTGAVAESLTYDAWGRVTHQRTPGFLSLGFAGRLYDQHSGLVRFGARDYDPAVGRWTCKDPVGFGGGDANLAAYCGGDPVNFIDPSGTQKSAKACFEAFANSPEVRELAAIAELILATTIRAIAAYREGPIFSTADRDAGAYLDEGTGFGISRGIGNGTSALAFILTGAGLAVNNPAFKNNALVGSNGPIFGRGAVPINKNPVVRVGYGWKKELGDEVFRIVVGRKSDPLPKFRHMDFVP
ncbi:MAG: RHS repeat-associated core domain-containing protein [Candidatus Eisenbacteria bacterium]